MWTTLEKIDLYKRILTGGSFGGRKTEDLRGIGLLSVYRLTFGTPNLYTTVVELIAYRFSGVISAWNTSPAFRVSTDT